MAYSLLSSFTAFSISFSLKFYWGIVDVPFHIFNFLELFLALWVLFFRAAYFCYCFNKCTSLTVFFFFLTSLLFPELSLFPPRSALLVNLGTSFSCCWFSTNSWYLFSAPSHFDDCDSWQAFLLWLCLIGFPKRFFVKRTPQKGSLGGWQAGDHSSTAKMKRTLLSQWRTSWFPSWEERLSFFSFLCALILQLSWDPLGYFTPRPSNHLRSPPLSHTHTR